MGPSPKNDKSAAATTTETTAAASTTSRPRSLPSLRRGKVTLILLMAILAASLFQVIYVHPSLEGLHSESLLKQHHAPSMLDRAAWKLTSSRIFASTSSNTTETKSAERLDSKTPPKNDAAAAAALWQKNNPADVAFPDADDHIIKDSEDTNQSADNKHNNHTPTIAQLVQINRPLLNILEEAQILVASQVEQQLTVVHPTDGNRNSNMLQIGNLTFPSWPAMQALYGPLQKPIIMGLERCQHYRDTVPYEKRYTAAAGMFNTGTNAMAFHLQKNVKARQVWQAPWGKHRMPFVRLKHVAPGMEREDQSQCLVVVMIRDPFHWMQSMCKMPYAAHWKKTVRKHCPNLVPSADDYQRFGRDEPDFANGTVPVKVIFDKQQIFYWDSLADLYSDYYRQYMDADYPRLIVRFEDMLLMPQAVIKLVAECAGVPVPPTFSYQTGSSKGHGSHTTFAKAIAKTGDETKRRAMLTKDDLVYAKQHLDPEILKVFRYSIPDMPNKAAS